MLRGLTSKRACSRRDGPNGLARGLKSSCQPRGLGCGGSVWGRSCRACTAARDLTRRRPVVRRGRSTGCKRGLREAIWRRRSRRSRSAQLVSRRGRPQLWVSQGAGAGGRRQGISGRRGPDRVRPGNWELGSLRGNLGRPREAARLIRARLVHLDRLSEGQRGLPRELSCNVGLVPWSTRKLKGIPRWPQRSIAVTGCVWRG